MPVAVLLAFIPLRLMGISLNVMSLAGIAIAFGELIDASIVVVEQTHKRLEQWDRAGRPRRHREVVLEAVKEVAGPTFFALLVIAVSFLPVFALEAAGGPHVQTACVREVVGHGHSALLALTLDPALRLLLTRARGFHINPAWLSRLVNATLVGHILQEERHPMSGFLMRIYEPSSYGHCRWKWIVFALALVLVLVTIPVNSWG